MSSETRKYFGTDGIRGTANHYPMTAEVALKLGMAAGHYFTRGDHRHHVVIAKDTRLSGYMIENALTAGFAAAGMHVKLFGPMPTPAVGMLTQSMRADIGVMISASHNQFQDNGIKIFGPDGHKLSDKAEMEIEKLMQQPEQIPVAEAERVGRVTRIEDARGRYIEYAKRSFPAGKTLNGMKVVIDCANGAAYQVAPLILRELGAEVIALGVAPNGVNINLECGSTHMQHVQQKVQEHKADIGIALDGDADRVILCDEQGRTVDGDQLMAVIARHWQELGRLNGKVVVATQMSNLGFERYLTSIGLALHRTKVGDRYVMEAMRKQQLNLGGEQSGHIIMSDYATTGDGLIAALQVLAVLSQQEQPASELLHPFEPYPQILENVRYGEKDPLEVSDIQQAIKEVEQNLNGKGRLLIRKSGTEPLIRIMAEGEDASEIQRMVRLLVEKVEQAA